MNLQQQTTVPRTSAGIREMLFNELDALRSGNSTPTKSNAIGRLAGSLLLTVRIEMDYAKFLKESNRTTLDSISFDKND